MVKHRTASDIAPVQPQKRESARYAEVVGPTPELTDEKRWDALRAVTWSHEHVAAIEPFDGGSPLSGVREVMEMLGLVGVEERTEGDMPVERVVLLEAVDHPERAVRCPSCEAPPGQVCFTVHATRSQRYERGHVERHRKAGL